MHRWLKDQDEPTLEIDSRQPGDGGGEGPGSAELGQAGGGPEKAIRGLKAQGNPSIFGLAYHTSQYAGPGWSGL